MPMVGYTEEELIEATEAAKADALRDFDEHRTRYMHENTMLRRECNDLLEALKDIVNGIDSEFGPSRTDTNFPMARRAITKYGSPTMNTQSTDDEPQNLPDDWEYQKATHSVICGGCCFRFGAEHIGDDGMWSCPCCGDGNSTAHQTPDGAP